MAGGSEIIINGAGVFIKTGGKIEVHTAHHKVEEGQRVGFEMPKLPSNTLQTTSHQFQISNANGQPAPDTDYLILHSKTGQVYTGHTDEKGLTQRVQAADPKDLQVFYDNDAYDKAKELGLL